MEWVLSAIIAPLIIAGVIAVFRLRGMAWLVSRPLRRSGGADAGRLFQSITVFNGGGLTEEAIRLRFPDRLNVELIASTEGVAGQDGSIVTIPSLPSADQCQLLVLVDEEITGSTPIMLRSKGIKSGSFAKSEKEVTTAAAIGSFLIFAIILLCGLALVAKWTFFAEVENSSPSVTSTTTSSDRGSASEESWPQWDSVDDFGESELAKFYPSPAFPVVLGDLVRKGDIATLSIMFTNVTPKPLTFTARIASSVTADDPEPWKRRDSIGNLVVGPASQQQVGLSFYFPRSTASGYVILDGLIRNGDNLHQFRKSVKVD